MSEFTPTTEQVRDGYRYDPEAEYRDPITPHHVINGRAFDRWLAQHDAAKDARIAELEAKVAECESGAEVEWGVRTEDGEMVAFSKTEDDAREWLALPDERLVRRTVGPWQEVPTTDEQRTNGDAG